MSSYGYIENNKIIAPVAMRSRFKQIGAWHLLTDAERAKHKWYPCDVINEGYDNLTQIRSSLPEITFDEKNQRITLTYTIVDKPLETIKREHKERITEARYQSEVSGFEFSGQWIDTDRVTQTRIAQAFSLIQIDPERTFNWKKENNEWTTMNAETVRQLSKLIGDHVQSCFDKEFELHKRIDEATTVEEVSEISWFD